MRKSIVSKSESVTLSVPERSSGPDLAALRRRAGEARDRGVHDLRIELDHARVLASPAIASLVAILRAARERGALVTLLTARRQIVDTLAVTGLDKVFGVEPPAQQRDAAEGQGDPRRPGRLVA